MFHYKDIRQVHLELTSNCQASCPMCERNINGGQLNPNLLITEIDLKLFKQIFHCKFLKQLNQISLCGNFGDPILSSDLLDICAYINSVNPNIHLDIYTNASARSTIWWNDLADVVPKNHSVIFAIDGLEDTHHIYRIKTDYNKIIENATAFIHAGGTAVWSFISFKHNEHQIELAKEHAKTLGFSKFIYKASKRFVNEERFPVKDEQGNIKYYLEMPTDNNIKLMDAEDINHYTRWVEQSDIDCAAKHKNEIYIDARGHLYPCCFLAGVAYTYADPNSITYKPWQEEKQRLKRFINSVGGYDSIDLRQNTIEDVINNKAWQDAWNTYWYTDKLATCAVNCGKLPEKIVSTIEDQIIASSKL